MRVADTARIARRQAGAEAEAENAREADDGHEHDARRHLGARKEPRLRAATVAGALREIVLRQEDGRSTSEAAAAVRAAAGDKPGQAGAVPAARNAVQDVQARAQGSEQSGAATAGGNRGAAGPL